MPMNLQNPAPPFFPGGVPGQSGRYGGINPGGGGGQNVPPRPGPAGPPMFVPDMSFTPAMNQETYNQLNPIQRAHPAWGPWNSGQNQPPIGGGGQNDSGQFPVFGGPPGAAGIGMNAGVMGGQAGGQMPMAAPQNAADTLAQVYGQRPTMPPQMPPQNAGQMMPPGARTGWGMPQNRMMGPQGQAAGGFGGMGQFNPFGGMQANNPFMQLLRLFSQNGQGGMGGQAGGGGQFQLPGMRPGMAGVGSF